MNKKNIFEEPLTQPPKSLEVLILTDSIGFDFIKSNCDTLKGLAEFNFIKLFFSPTTCQTKIDKVRSITNYDLQYEYSNNPTNCFVGSIKKTEKDKKDYTNESISAFSMMRVNQPSKDHMEGYCGNSKVKYFEIEIIERVEEHELFDFVVACDEDIKALAQSMDDKRIESLNNDDTIHQNEKDDFLKKLKPTTFDNFINFTDLLEYIRLFALNNKIFKVVSSYDINSIDYYRYRRVKLFEKLHTLWCIVGRDEQNWNNSLYKRIEIYLKSIDRIKLNILRLQNKFVADEYLYDLGVLIITTSAIFDNFAWIISELYDLGFDYTKRSKVSLRKIGKNEFGNALCNESQNLHDYIYSENNQKIISLMQPVRDSIAHRDYFSCILYNDSYSGISQREDKQEIVLVVPAEIKTTIESIKQSRKEVFEKEDIFCKNVQLRTSAGDVIPQGDILYLKPSSFINDWGMLFEEIVNGILDIICSDKGITNYENLADAFFKNPNGNGYIKPIFF